MDPRCTHHIPGLILHSFSLQPLTQPSPPQPRGPWLSAATVRLGVAREDTQVATATGVGAFPLFVLYFLTTNGTFVTDLTFLTGKALTRWEALHLCLVGAVSTCFLQRSS